MTIFAESNDEDYFGESIAEHLVAFIDNWYEEFFTYDRQIPGIPITLVFIDSQLLEYDIIEMIINVYNERSNRAPVNNVIDFFAATGIYFYVHYYEFIFEDLYLKANNQAYLLDFESYDNFEYFCNNYVGNVNMCALGIWQFDDYLYSLLYALQNQWPNKNMPIYCFLRDPIPIDPNTLIIKIYNSVGGSGSSVFITPEEAMAGGAR